MATKQSTAWVLEELRAVRGELAAAQALSVAILLNGKFIHLNSIEQVLQIIVPRGLLHLLNQRLETFLSISILFALLRLLNELVNPFGNVALKIPLKLIIAHGCDLLEL